MGMLAGVLFYHTVPKGHGMCEHRAPTAWLEREPLVVLQQGQGAGLTSYRVGTTKPTHCHMPRALPSHYGGGWGQLPCGGPYTLRSALQDAPGAPVGQSAEQRISFRGHKLRALNQCTSCCVPR